VAQIAVEVNGRRYQIACDDGQEAHLTRLGGYIDKRVQELVAAVGQIGDAHLLVMVSLLIADELSDAYAQLEAGRVEGAAARSDADDRLAGALETLARRIESVAERIEAT
jgi:cell division protein ZapA